MKELLRRLFLHPFLAFEIILASFFINVLSLASPIFVIQVLNRYVGYGFDGTLVTLTVGMLIAGVMSHGFTTVRIRLASAVNVQSDRELASSVLNTLTRARLGVLGRIPPARIHELMGGVQTVQGGYDASVICSVLDMPFFLLFVGAVFFLSPLLALITLLAVICTLFAGWLSMKRGKGLVDRMRGETVNHRSHISSAIEGADTVRAFGGSGYLSRIWSEQVTNIQQIKRNMTRNGARSQAVLQSLSMLLRVMVYALGAREVVAGTLTMGGLIGVSILSGKALGIASSFMKSRSMIERASDMMKSLREFMNLPLESSQGTTLSGYKGDIEFKDLGFAYPGSTGPLFEGLDLKVSPGAFVVITGPNGSGKTTLVRLMLGLLDPGRGQVFAGGVDLRQIASSWWRAQVIYFPQEPTFLNATIKENICLNCPEMDTERLNKIVDASGLRRYLDTSAKGLDERIVNGGSELAVGIRRRLALARALAVQGAVAVLDEPMEGLDLEGRKVVSALIQGLVKADRTIFMVTQDMGAIERADVVIDLTPKPRPGILYPNEKPEADGNAGKKGEPEAESPDKSGNARLKEGDHD